MARDVLETGSKMSDLRSLWEYGVGPTLLFSVEVYNGFQGVPFPPPNGVKTLADQRSEIEVWDTIIVHKI